MEDFRLGTILKVQRDHTREKIFSAMEKMREIGLNTVLIWPAIFWWEDRTLPGYPFATGHAILEYAEKIGLKVVLELAGQIPCLEYAPDFRVKEEHFPVDANGMRSYTGNLYGFYNYNHPEIKKMIEEHYASIARNYRGYSALYGYDIWNETDFTSFDEHTLQLFREWLQAKYGTLEKLNEVWDRTYTDWSQIDFARWLWASAMPKVDYEEFHKDNIGIILRYMRQAIRKEDPGRPVISDNTISMITLPMAYGRGQDDRVVAENADIFGMDMYPKYKKLSFQDFLRHQTFEAASSATCDGSFWVSEMQTHYTSIFDPESYVYLHDLRFWTWEAVSHGAKGILYWKWEPFNKGLQTFGRGLVDFKGNYTPRALEVKRIAEVMESVKPDIRSFTPEKPKAAILFDRLSYDFVETLRGCFGNVMGSGNSDAFYTDSAMGLYKCLWDMDIPACFITDRDVESGKADDYSAVFISNHINISEGFAQALVRYMERGGIVVADGKFGEFSDTGLVYDRIPGAGLHKEAGFELGEMQPFRLNMTLSEAVGGSLLSFDGYLERREMMLAADTRILAAYCDGCPAVVYRKVGKGAILYASTMLWIDYLKNPQTNEAIQSLVAFLDREASLRTYELNGKNLKASVLRGEKGLLLVVFNYSDTTASGEVKLPTGTDSVCRIIDLYNGNERVQTAEEGKLSLAVTLSGKNVGVFHIEC